MSPLEVTAERCNSLVISQAAEVPEGLLATLAAAGMTVGVMTARGQQGPLWNSQRPDIVILDGAGECSLRSRIRRLRNRFHSPVVVLEGTGLEYERVRALNAGADDCLSKPVSDLELVARLRSILRRRSRRTEFIREPVQADPDGVQSWRT